jgi:hypothetical protein
MTTDPDRARRAGRREANLRQLNERIVAAEQDATDGALEELVIVCECALEQCDRTIRLPEREYDRIRDRVDEFVVIDGHVLAEVETAVEQHDGWQVVHKRGPSADEAAKVLS